VNKYERGMLIPIRKKSA